MGAVYRPTSTRPVPNGAEILARRNDRVARWTDSRGRVRTAPVTTGADGTSRIVQSPARYVAKYRDGAGIVVVVPTGCRDETAARKVLSDLEVRADKVRSKLRTAGEDRAIDHGALSIFEHAADYLLHLKAKGTTPHHRRNVEGQLVRLLTDCGFRSLMDLDRWAVERWLVAREDEGMGARTRNTHLAALIGMANWCVREQRLAFNPLAGIAKADEKSDRRHQRRSLTEPELIRLLEVARERPLREVLTVRRGARKGQLAANVAESVQRRLEDLGRERALTYKMLVLTGLRKGELASLTVGSLELDRRPPSVNLAAADEKSRRGTDIPLRADLAADIRSFLADRLQRLQDRAREAGDAVPMRLPSTEPLFRVPSALCRILDRDLVAAGIATIVTTKSGVKKIDKRDERGRTIDVHALRTTFGTLLSKGGVPLRTAQAAMRHSDPSLTANIYTDPKLLDIGGAMDALPALPLNGMNTATTATGTSTTR